MTIKELTKKIEELAPLSLQESYDNAGLIIGDPTTTIEGALITLDVTEEVMYEAINNGCNLIVAHHPMIFTGIKKLNNESQVERMIVLAIKHDIAIYAAHTNLDNVQHGVNAMIAEKIGLINTAILAPKDQLLKKLVTFCPVDHAQKLREVIFRAGAGQIGNYDSCSFNIIGDGTFRAGEEANPFVGEVNQLHTGKEVRIETVFPDFLKNRIVSAMLETHPYEEVAYDIYPIDNRFGMVGAGMAGELEKEEETNEFFVRIKRMFGTGCIRHTKIIKARIAKVALCGGSGSFLLHDAIASGADIFVTGDMKYHDFFEADNRIIVADIGHYESEQFTKELLMNFVKKNIATFAVRISEINTNPISYR